MSTPVGTTTSHHLSVATGIARDQAESLARGNDRPDDGFWRDVFERAGGQAGMAGSGVSIQDGGMPDATQALRPALDKPLQGSTHTPSATHAGDAGSSSQGDGRGAFDEAARPRTPQGAGAGLAAVPHRTVVSGHPVSLRPGSAHGQSGDVSPNGQCRPGGGAPHASARLPAPVVVTVAAASSEEWRVYLRGQGLTPARALALASQAASGTDQGADGAPPRHVASVVLNGHTIYSTGGPGGDDTPGPSSFSLTA